MNSNKLIKLIAAVAVTVGLGLAEAQAAPKYWDTTAGAGNGVGGSGTLSAQTTALFSNTATGDATLSAAATTDDGIFQGTPGTVTFGSNFTLASAAFNVTGYTLTTSGTSTRVFTAPITLANNVTLSLSPIAAAALTIGSVTGGTGSALRVGGTTAAATDTIRINLLNGSTIAASAPITIATTGTTGVAGFVSTGANATINADITNNSAVATMIGATSGNAITLGGALRGSAAVQFSAGSSGGAGTINLNAASTYTGETRFNGTASGAVKLGVDDALPTTTALILGFSSGNGQKLDLNGHNQTVASLASNTGGTGSITSSAAGTGTDTLTINGAASTTFALAITDGATRKVGLALAATNTGSLALTGANTYAGGTNVNGGTLLANNSSGSATGSGPVTVNNSGTLGGIGAISGATTINGGGRITGATAGTIGALTLQNNVTFSGASGSSLATYFVDLASGANNSDRLLIGGGLNLGSFDQIQFNGTADGTSSYNLATYTSVSGIFDVETALPAGYQLVYGTTSLDLVPVPEPATWLAAALAVAALAFHQRRRWITLLRSHRGKTAPGL